jgi:pyrroline-5-carboxylate reductase
MKNKKHTSANTKTKPCIGILGAGNMGEALIAGLVDSGYNVVATTKSPDSAQVISKKLGIICHTNNGTLAKVCDVIIICVKPHQIKEACASIAKQLAATGTRQKLVISIAAGVTILDLKAMLGSKAAILRAMPNTPAMIRKGITVIASSGHPETALGEHLNVAHEIFSCVGQAIQLEESLLDGVTGLSGCGPAYVFVIIEALAEAGVKVGLPRKAATLLAAQTLMGAAQMVLDRGEHPAALKDEVTTPAGCTIDGLMALEEGKLRVTLIKAVLAATERSRSLK